MYILQDLLSFIPEATLIVMCFSVLFIRLAAADVKQHEYVFIASQVSLLITFIALLWCQSLATPGFSFHELWVADKLAYNIKEVLTVFAMVIFAYGYGYLEDSGSAKGDYYILAILSLFGMFVMVSAANMLTAFLGLEVMSLPMYAMVALWRAEHNCVEAALKYFITGAIATCLLLYGFSLLYGVTASLSFVGIKEYLAVKEHVTGFMLTFSLAFIVAGFAFKLGAVPFHMWMPDIYEGSPTPVTMFVASLPKIATVILMLRLFDYALPELSTIWGGLLTIVAILSIVIGNIIAVAQKNLKRLLAYSSIAHMGYLMLGFVAFNINGSAAALFYVLMYALATIAIFGIMLSVKSKNNYLNNISDLANLHAFHPLQALIVLITLFSMAGVPPIVGFIAKMWIFSSLIVAHKTMLAIIAVLFTLIGAFYYIKVIKVMYFNDKEEPAQHSLVMTSSKNVILIINGALILLLGLFPTKLLLVCSELLKDLV
jgi:NADH-quinone oxidoreductase subunit N